MKPLKPLLLALAAVALATPALAQDVPDRIKKAGKLVIATMPNYPPITYKDPATSKLMGFDIELGEAIAKELGALSPSGRRSPSPRCCPRSRPAGSTWSWPA